MKKWISWLVLIVMLGIVPLGSWYYLKQGLDYRKNALEELKPKSSVEWMGEAASPFAGKTTLWVLDSSAAEDVLPPVIDQFSDAYTFQLAGHWNGEGVVYIPDSLLNIYAKSGAVFALVDTAKQIRNYYSGDTAELRKMVEHLAVLLPNVKDKDIKMK